MVWLLLRSRERRKRWVPGWAMHLGLLSWKLDNILWEALHGGWRNEGRQVQAMGIRFSRPLYGGRF